MSASARQLVLVAKIILLTLILTAVSGIGSQMLPALQEAGQGATAADPGPPSTPPGGSFLALVLFLMLLQTLALAYPILRSRWTGWRLVLTILVVFFGTATLMGQIESAVYLGEKLPAGMLSGLFAMGLLNAVVFAPIAVLVLGRWKRPASAGVAASQGAWPVRWIWQVPVAGAVYLALYYLFGYYVAWKNPAVRDYYGGVDPGSFFAQIGSIIRAVPWMIPLQFGRGMLWVLLALPVIRLMRGPWWEAGLALAMLFTVPSIFLLLPNPMMPDAVRTAHLIETVPYQFLFGWFVAWFLRDEAT